MSSGKDAAVVRSPGSPGKVTVTTLRRHDLDNLRIFLTGIVTAHHGAIAYGGIGSWIYKSVGFAPNTSPLLVGLNAFDQSFFMGMFFWTSGRLSAQSLARSPPETFLHGRALRLGVPALAYSYLVDPVMRAALSSSWDLPSLRTSLVGSWRSGLGLRGPVWYAGTLLAFDLAAALGKKFGILDTQKRRTKDTAQKYKQLCRFGWLGIGAASFLVRLWYPVGTNIPVLNLQLAFAPQYIFAYILGIMSYRDNEDGMYSPLGLVDPSLDTIQGPAPGTKPTSRPRTGLARALALSLSTMSLIALLAYISAGDSWLAQIVNQFVGGPNLTAATYALWNELSFAVLAPALLRYFRQWCAGATTSNIIIPRLSYIAFLLHAPVTVAVQVLADKALFPRGVIRPWMRTAAWKILAPIAMTIGVGLASNYASFYLGGLFLSYVPGARNVV